MSDDTEALIARYWSTEIIDVQPGSIRVRGYPVEQLIGVVDFPSMAWLMLRGELPSRRQAELLGAMLVAGVDHGPHAPSIAIARMAMSCGVGINNAMASAANVLGDVHGGAGEQLMELLAAVAAHEDSGVPTAEAARTAICEFRAQGERYVPGFGHRFHPVDPRGPRLAALVEAAVADGVVGGRYLAIARAMHDALAEIAGRPLTMNIDGSGAVVLSELGFAPMLGRGLFVLSRSVGILAHAWEQQQRAERNKGPAPRAFRFGYEGPPARDVPGT